MYNLSAVTLEGFATRDPELKTTKTGKHVCEFSLALNHNSKDDDAHRVSYVDVEAWEKMAEICAAGISKGKRVLVLGSLRQDRWEGKDGKIQSKLKCVAGEVRFIESFRKLPGGEEGKSAEAA